MQQMGAGKRAMRTLVFAAFLMLAAGIASIMGADKRILPYIVSLAMAMLFVSIFLFFRQKDEPVQDERTKAVQRKALSVSWWLTYVLIAVLMIAEEFNFAELSVSSVLGLTFFFMVASQEILRWHYSGKSIE